MKKILFASLLMLILSECSPSKVSELTSTESGSAKNLPQKREYTFVETVDREDYHYTHNVYERAPITIVATSDIEALMIAYRNQCVTEAEHLGNKYGCPDSKGFRLYDDSGAEIKMSVVKKVSKPEQDRLDKRMKDIRAEIFNLYDVEEPEY